MSHEFEFEFDEEEMNKEMEERMRKSNEIEKGLEEAICNLGEMIEREKERWEEGEKWRRENKVIPKIDYNDRKEQVSDKYDEIREMEERMRNLEPIKTVYKGGENGLDWNVPSTLFSTRSLFVLFVYHFGERGRATTNHLGRGRATTNHLGRGRATTNHLGREGATTNHLERGEGQQFGGEEGQPLAYTSSTLFPTKSLFVLFGKRRTWYTKLSSFQTTLPNQPVSKQLCQTN